MGLDSVIPAKAGIQKYGDCNESRAVDSRFRRNDSLHFPGQLAHFAPELSMPSPDYLRMPESLPPHPGYFSQLAQLIDAIPTLLDR
jgi:hypothetical protein